MRLENITWVQAGEYFKQHDMVIIAIGSLECHGTHLALGTDTIVPNRILALIEEKSDVLIAPTVPYAVCDLLSDYPGTVTLGMDVFYQMMSKICDNLYRHGARKFVFLNGHGGNIIPLERVGFDLDRKGAMAVVMNWWLMAWDLNPAWKGGHGGGEETAAMLAIDPALVDRAAIRDMTLANVTDEIVGATIKTVKFKGIEHTMPRHTMDISDNGWFGADHPKDATAEWGREMLQATADYIVDFMEEFKKAKLKKV
ncbi:MAG TPA: creatininase family protein [Candidatus Acidoferrum sp.]|nr:creatininase family protein [Candidatus Acidoferrum sp.]